MNKTSHCFVKNDNLERLAESPCISVRKNKKSFKDSYYCIGSPLEFASIASVNLFLAVYQSNHFFTKRLKAS